MAVSPRELHRVAITAIIYKEGKYLIIKRSPNVEVFPNRWTVPGGGVSMDDYEHLPYSTAKDKQWYFALEGALKREVKEEVNLEIGKIGYLLDVIFIRPDGIPAIVLSFLAPYVSGEVKLNEENTEYAWVTVEEAKNYDFLGDILMEIEMADKRLKK